VGNQGLLVARVEGCEIDSLMFTHGAAHEVDEVAAVGEEMRPPMGVLLAREIDLSDLSGLPAGCGDPIECVANAWRKQNDAIAVPCASTTAGGIAYDLRRPAADPNGLQLPMSEEPDGITIR
jgi:hypothetical protein